MTIRHRIRFLFLLFFFPLLLHSQEFKRSSDIQPDVEAIPEPMPGDVLNPDARGNSPNIKVALKVGINRSVYTNDRFPDNRPFDVGTVFGEADVYGSAAGFGSQVGVEVEIPSNTVFSWALSARYDHIFFGNSGPVEDVCFSAEGDSIGINSTHTFEVTIDYLKLAGVAKLNFQKFYVLAGLTLETPISNSILFDRQHNGMRCFYPEPRDIRNSPNPVPIPAISSLHSSLRLGAGLNYRLSERLQFSPELTLDFGFNAINKSPESGLGVYAVSGVLRYDL